ncbi:MAG: hypothetical protein H7338_03925 [Candidatus Sericytochromatia bacterium]|nr:hypothetical protein [Candidatus Sericytochromatia bacterium]
MFKSCPDPALAAHITACWPLPGVRAGSALIRRHDRLLIVQDDALAVILLDMATGTIQTLGLRKSQGTAMSKATKPDFELAVAGPDGAIVILGSGSTPDRRRIAVLDPNDGQFSVADGDDLYAAVAEALGHTPNLEGAVRQDETLRLFHRGAASQPSASIELPWTAPTGGPISVTAVVRLDLGTVAGVPLTLTDATIDGAGHTLYTAVAEDTPNAIDDGPIVAMAIGILTDTHGRWAPLTEPDGQPSTRKVEGIALDPGGRSGYLVTDPDDPALSAVLCRFALTGPWS